MKKNLSIKFLVLFLALFVCFSFNDKAYAAVDVSSTNMETAQEIVFNETYNLLYAEDITYMKLSIKQQGILSMNFTKPINSRGEFQRLYLDIYDEASNVVYSNYTCDAAEDSSEYYNMNVGLGVGTYYVLIELPETEGVCSVFKPTFTATEYCETEDNNNYTTADAMSLGMVYTGYYGKDSLSSGDSCNYDYWKVDLQAGVKYKVKLTREKVSSYMTDIVTLEERGGGNSEFINWNGNALIDGSYVTIYTPRETCTHYFTFYNYSREPYKYTISIDVEPTDISEETLTLDKVDYSYTGKAIKPKVTVKCGDVILIQDVDYTVTYSKNKNIGKGKVTVKGKGNYTGSLESEFNIVAKKGATFTLGNNKYKVLEKNSVAFTGLKNSKVTKVVIPSSVKYGGKTFKVTTVAKAALKNKNKVTKVTIGTNIKTIEKQAFYGCKKLKTIVIESSKLKTVSKDSFKNTHSKAVVKVPSKKLKGYKTLLKNKGFKSTVKFIKK